MKSTVENGAYLAMLRRIVRAAGTRIGSGDVDDFAQLVKCKAELDLAVQVAVAGLRASGVTWQEIGAATGTSHSAAMQKWASKARA